MDDELYFSALKDTLDEIRNVCPDIKNSFVFKENGELIAGDEGISEKTVKRVIAAIGDVLEKAEAIGGVKRVTIEGTEGRVNISSMNDFYLVTVTSKDADNSYVNTITHILIPTVLKLLNRIVPAPSENHVAKPETEPEVKPELPMDESAEESMEEAEEEPPAEESEETLKPEGKSESDLQEHRSTQLIVENIGGLLVSSDTVRVDNITLSKWQELYKGRRIEEVEIDTFKGKMTRCKVKPAKDSRYDGKGIIQMPEKMRHALEIRKGELVRAKPVFQ